MELMHTGLGLEDFGECRCDLVALLMFTMNLSSRSEVAHSDTETLPY